MGTSAYAIALITVIALACNGGAVAPEPDDRSPTISLSPTVTLKDGVLIQGEDGAIYVIKDTLKHLIPGPAEFRACGYSETDVIAVPQAVVDDVPEGSAITLDPCRQTTVEPVDGVLIQAEDQRVYYIEDEMKRLIPGPVEFEACAFHSDDVVHVTQAAVDAIEEGPLVQLEDCKFLVVPRDGMLIVGDDRKVYFIENETKRLIAGPVEFEACNFATEDIFVVAQEVVDAIEEGPAIRLQDCKSLVVIRDGMLIAGDDRKVYFIENGMKRLIPGAVEFEACAFVEQDIFAVPQGVVDEIPDGPPVELTTCPELLS